MYGKLDSEGNITFYNGFYITHGDITTTNPSEAALLAAGYKPIVDEGTTINVSTVKMFPTFTETEDKIIMKHKTQNYTPRQSTEENLGE